MSVRDPNSADANAQAPEAHPDAQVRVDQSVKLTGVQQPVYPLSAIEQATAFAAQQAAEPTEAAQPPSEPAPPEAGGDPIPAGEVHPDEPAADASKLEG